MTFEVPQRTKDLLIKGFAIFGVIALVYWLFKMAKPTTYISPITGLSVDYKTFIIDTYIASQQNKANQPNTQTGTGQ